MHASAGYGHGLVHGSAVLRPRSKNDQMFCLGLEVKHMPYTQQYMPGNKS